VGVERMLRLYLLQQWFNLSDPAVEKSLYESASMRQFVGIDLGQEPVPDETTICRFRHLLEKRELGEAMLETVNHHLGERGTQIATGTIVDATIIHAPSSTQPKTIPCCGAQFKSRQDKMPDKYLQGNSLPGVLAS